MSDTTAAKAKRAAYMRGLRADQKAGRKPKQSRPGRPFKPVSRYAIDHREWIGLAMRYAYDNAIRKRGAFDGSVTLINNPDKFPAKHRSTRQLDWEEMAQDFRAETWRQLMLICARAPRDVLNPKALILHHLNLRMPREYARIRARYSPIGSE